MEQLEEAVLGQYWRLGRSQKTERSQEAESSQKGNRQTEKAAPALCVSLEDPGTLETAAACPDVQLIYLDSTGFGAEAWERAVKSCHQAGKTCGLIMPQIFRREAEHYFRKHGEKLKAAGFDCFLLRSMEEPEFLSQMGLGEIPMIFDANLYVMNHRAAEEMEAMGASRLTLPLELNSRELEELLSHTERSLPWEMVVYGHYPAMVSAQCIVRTTKGCKKQPELLKLKDRKGAELPVKNHCRFCYNTIYNPSPLCLLGQEDTVERLQPDVLRLSFTVEDAGQVKAVLQAYGDHFLRGINSASPVQDFTRGHLKRGVE